MRFSNDEYVDSYLKNGYDYEKQAWVVNGRYISCWHPEEMECNCFGRLHEGEQRGDIR